MCTHEVSCTWDLDVIYKFYIISVYRVIHTCIEKTSHSFLLIDIIFLSPRAHQGVIIHVITLTIYICSLQSSRKHPLLSLPACPGEIPLKCKHYQSTLLHSPESLLNFLLLSFCTAFLCSLGGTLHSPQLTQRILSTTTTYLQPYLSTS